MVKNLQNNPSIIMWCIFNENQGQFDPARLAGLVAKLDSSRLINQGSGGPYDNAGDIYDVHSYPPPACPDSTTQARVCGEYGGIGFNIPNHQWDADNSASYIMVDTPDELTNLYDTFANSLIDFKTNKGLSAAVYTEITDVETEVNGLMTYDRKMKMDVSKIKASNDKIINKQISFTDILPTSKNQSQTWKYTTTTPDANWFKANFSDTSWSSGQGGFGTKATTGVSTSTTWDTSDIWMRKSFNPGKLTAKDISNLSFDIFHDDDCDIYVNGVLAASVTGYTTGYQALEMNKAGKDAILSNANNVIAVHCHQILGGQGIDVGIRKTIISNPPKPSKSFSDNFNKLNKDKWTNFGGTWGITNKQYTVASNSGAKSMANNTNFSDFTYETDITIGNTGSNTNSGVLFRTNSPGVGVDSYTGYYAGIGTGETGTDSGVILGKSNGRWTPLLFKPIPIDITKSHHMKVIAIGSSIKVYVDDMSTPVIDTVDTSYNSGAIGVRTWNIDAKYDNVSVNSFKQ